MTAIVDQEDEEDVILPAESMSDIAMPEEYRAEMERMAKFLVQKMFETVNAIIADHIQKYPQLNDSVTRFTMGQTMMLGSEGHFASELHKQMIIFLANATNQFIATAETKRGKEKLTPPEYIR